MALAESINIKVENSLTTLINRETDVMVIGGIASNLLSTDSYLTIRPFLVNAKIDQGFPFQLQSKVFIPGGVAMVAIVSETPINLIWNVSGDGWNSGNIEDWNSSDLAFASVLLNLTIAEI